MKIKVASLCKDSCRRKVKTPSDIGKILITLVKAHVYNRAANVALYSEAFHSQNYTAAATYFMLMAQNEQLAELLFLPYICSRESFSITLKSLPKCQ